MTVRASTVTDDQPQPKTRDFRNVSEWHSRSERARRADCAQSRTYDVDVTPEGDQLCAEVRDIPGGTFAPNLTDLREFVRELIVLGADLPDDAQPKFVLHYQWPEHGHPSLQSDVELFDDPEEMAVMMESLGVTVDQVRMGRASGLI